VAAQPFYRVTPDGRVWRRRRRWRLKEGRCAHEALCNNRKIWHVSISADTCTRKQHVSAIMAIMK